MRIHDRALLPRTNSAGLKNRPLHDVGRSTEPAAPSVSSSDAFVCERCGTAMFRMHAVWRCPSCGFKTDCCGW